MKTSAQTDPSETLSSNLHNNDHLKGEKEKENGEVTGYFLHKKGGEELVEMTLSFIVIN